jgi:cobalt-zinc-cadmium efflux system outer membrane protein
MKQRLVLLGLCATALISSSIFAQTLDKGSLTQQRAGVPSPATPLTLEEAWRVAEQSNPALQSAQAGRLAAEGQFADSRALLWHNPELSYEINRRTAPQAGGADQRYREWAMGLSQTFEIAGQKQHRLNAARDDLAATDATIAELRQQLRADVEERFVKVLALQRRIAIERENLKLVENSSQAIGKRVTAGEASRIEGNVAKVEAERTRNQLAALDEQLVTVQAELAQVLQLQPDARPEVRGELTRPASYQRDALIEQATQRPQLAAQLKRENAARSRLDLERASAYPDVTVGLNIARDGPSDLRERVIGMSVSVPLPLFKRNQSGIGKAMSELTQVQIERQAGERDIRAAVLAQWTRYQQLISRSNRLKSAVLPPLEDNLRLSQIAFQAGEIGLTDLLLVNRQVLDGRRDMLDVETELRFAQIALERAAGWNIGKQQ